VPLLIMERAERATNLSRPDAISPLKDRYFVKNKPPRQETGQGASSSSSQSIEVAHVGAPFAKVRCNSVEMMRLLPTRPVQFRVVYWRVHKKHTKSSHHPSRCAMSE
jgi:hypothetical protein